MKSTNRKNYLFPTMWLLAVVLGLQSARAQNSTNLPAYESFPQSLYAEGEQLGAAGSSGTNWSTGNSASSSSARIRQSAAMIYPSLTTEATNISRGLSSGTGTGKNRGFFFAPTITNGTIYASFLFTLTNYPASPRLFSCLSSGSGTGPTIDAGIYLDAAGHLLVGKNAAIGATSLPNSPTTYAMSLGNSYLVVLRYTFNSGSSTNDEVALWLDPTSLGGTTAPPPSISTTNGTDTTGTTGFQTFYYLDASSGLNVFAGFFMDEIRVGTNWAQVTPTNSIAGNIYAVTGGGSGCQGESFAVGLNGSDLNVSYLLYTNGVSASQSVNGTGSSITFGPQTATALYTVLATNNNTAGLSWMSSNAAVTVFLVPTVVTQPSPVVTATNSTAVYFANVSGGGLNYRWYRNGTALTDGSRIFGSATATLTISPVLASDAATTTTGYYCIITNRCGASTTTVTNGLTIQTANNLVWQGVPANTWDIATTANWTNSAGSAVVFNTGDNVTFDDSAQNQLVLLSSPYLSPGTVTYNSANSLAISGTGNIFGSNSVLNVIGTGTLTISNANSFAGGTLISNGVAFLRNYGALGVGPITLAGGSLGTATLQIPIGGNGSLGLVNNIFAQADSIFEYDATGTSASVLFGAINGNPGVTLTINHAGTGTDDRLRIYNTNFTCNANLNLNSTYIHMAPFNGSGSQIYNGIISGSGAIEPLNGSGSIVLNNTNTYTGGTLLGGGTIGIGSDSAADLSSGPLGTANVTFNTGNGSATFFASGAAHTVSNSIVYTTTASTAALIFIGTNQLTLGGTIDISTTVGDPNPTNRAIQADGAGGLVISGVITDNSGLGCGITKTGTNTLYLNGVNTYTGPTAINAGVLAGTGTIAGPVTVGTNGTIGAGSPTTLGTLTLSGDLTINGKALFRLNKSLAQSNDLIAVSGVLTNTGTGTVTVSNVGPALVVGDTFTLFSEAVSNGAALTITGSGMTWSNKLALDGSVQVIGSAGPTVITVSPAITNFSLAGNNVVISGTNGQAGRTAYLLMSTNLSMPRNQWKTVATGVLGGNAYTFTGTNVVTPIAPQKFYLLSSTNYNP